MKKIFSFLIILFLLMSAPCYANRVALNEIIAEILDNSHIKKSSELNLEASKQNADQAENHWLPLLYVDSKTYQTNDPALNLMGNLYQRATTQADFNPANINRRENKFFSKSTIGVNLPLYQGGLGSANYKRAQGMVVAEKFLLKQTEIEQYAKICAIYITLVSLEQQRQKLEKISAGVKQILQKYLIRDKKNQVGYSGYLSLEASHNKIKSFIIDNQEKTNSLYKILAEMGLNRPSSGREDSWQVEYLPVEQYLKKYLNLPTLQNKDSNDDLSFKTSSIKARLEADKNQEKIDNAQNLPHINLYAENYSFRGARDSQYGYNAGINLHWNFYDPLNFNNKDIAINKTKSLRHEFLSHQQQERTELEYINAEINSLNESIKLLSKNDELMAQNVEISKELFRAGAINALNLSDSIMQYLDNFIFLSNSQIQLIERHSKKITKQKIDINEIIAKQ